MVAHAAKALALETAFNAFNEHSLSLEASYRALQGTVDILSRRLQASQSAHHRELLAKVALGERLQHMLETLPGAIVVIDADGIIRERNSKASELLNRPLRGRAWAEVVQREFAASGDASGDLNLHDGRILSLARRSLHPDGGEILLLTDVTESRRMAEMLARQQRLSAIGEMTARLAHQIRTPLASALLYASRLAHGDRDPAVTGDRIVGRLRELDGMVQDMLRYAAGARDDDAALHVHALLTDVAESCQPQLAGGRELTLALSDPSLVIVANGNALKGALTNLVNNAAAACADGGQIELSAFADGNDINITVTDNGTGIAAEHRARIFEPFFTTRPHGTGLGLAVVRSVAEAHAGEVLVETGPWGTTIALCLPQPAMHDGGERQ